MIGGDVTVIGPAIVGATRMQQAAKPGETLVSATFGDELFARTRGDPRFARAFQVERLLRPTKEHPEGVVVYRVGTSPRITMSAS